jgi:hypothetical protein
MNSIECKICSQEFENFSIFLEHLKAHSISPKKYCEEKVCKKDIFNGNSIRFKSLEQYLLTDFESKTNMMNWLKYEKDGLAKKFIFDKIKSFSFIKSVSIFPSSSELRTISYLPSLKTIGFFYNNLNEFIDSTGMRRRYNYDINELKLNFIHKKNIIIDTREQKPLNFKNLEPVSSKLEYGDYSYDGILSVERKSLNDLVSTLSSGFDRFKNEISRAKESEGYIAVVVDCDINRFLSFEYSSRVGKYAKASKDFIFHRMRDICKMFPDSIQFCFSGGRIESAKIIPTILSNEIKKVSSIDFQYIIEKNLM